MASRDRRGARLYAERFHGGGDFRESLAYLYGLQRFGMVFGLSNIRRITRVLGHPEDGLRVIHVGGTNGKGSTAAMIASILQKSGHRVGLYTSPHLVSFTERIQIDGHRIREAEVARLTARIRERIETAGIPQRFTFFDFTTAMAFLFFAESKVDLTVVEVGLGGRLDSTNIVFPLVSVVTNVAHEHRDVLGGSLKEIAREKAGIIKQGIPVVTGVGEENVFHEIERVAQERAAPLYRMGRDFSSREEGVGRFAFEGRRWHLAGLGIRLLGKHQVANATLALGTLETLEGLEHPVTPQAVRRGLLEIDWPGRLEVIREKPWVVLDGAHNPSGARALVEALTDHFPHDRCYFLLGIMEDKEVERIVSILAPLSHETVICRPNRDRAAAPERLLRAHEAVGGKGRIIPDVAEGLDVLISMAGRDDLICVAGSFYTVGEARSHLLGI